VVRVRGVVRVRVVRVRVMVCYVTIAFSVWIRVFLSRTFPTKRRVSNDTHE
jgi:hypothetical protein